MLFENKVVLVTGASSGIGRATALAFAREGAQVMLADVNADGGGETLNLIQGEGGTASFITADVSRADEVRAMIDATIAQYGGLHIAVNNAGIAGDLKPLHEIEEDEYDTMMGVNIKGVWLCLKHEIPAIVRSGGGSIVNMASIAGLVGFVGGSTYSASKHAVVGLTKSAALELATQGIRVNAVCPSFVNTPMVTDLTDNNEKMARHVNRASPMRRLGSPSEVAAAILWLASDQASFITGIALAADGGLTAM